jgi:hypothetical protein
MISEKVGFPATTLLENNQASWTLKMASYEKLGIMELSEQTALKTL